MKNFKIIISIIFLASNLFGQGVTYNEEFLVMPNAERPCVADLPNGGFVICWQKYAADGSEANIYAQIYDEKGVIKKDEFIVNTTLPMNQLEPRLASLANGDFVICWISLSQDASHYALYCQIFNSTGIRVGSEIQVNTIKFSGNVINPNLCGLNGGGFVITWQVYGIDGSEFNIKAQVFEADGNKKGNEFAINESTYGEQSSPSVSFLSNGGFVVCWQSMWQDGSDYGIYAQIFNENMQKVGHEFRVNTFTEGMQSLPSVSGLVNGGFVVTWQSASQEGPGTRIYAQIYTNNGVKLNSEFKVNNLIYKNQKEPSIRGLTNGGFVIIWVADHPSKIDRLGVFTQIFNDSGNKYGNEFFVGSVSPYWGIKANISQLDNGGYILCWSEPKTWGLGNIYAKYYLGEPVRHTLNNFGLIEPRLDASLIEKNPLFKWQKTTKTRFNFPWEQTYDLYVSTNSTFTEPIVIKGIEDTTYRIDALVTGNTYFWKVLAKNYYEDSLWSSDVSGFYIDPDAATDIDDDSRVVPEKFALFQNYPNPFNPTTTIRYTIPVVDAKFASTTANVTLNIYNVLGKEIKTLVNNAHSPGNYEVKFEATGLPSGIYYYQLKSGNFINTKKMLHLK